MGPKLRPGVLGRRAAVGLVIVAGLCLGGAPPAAGTERAVDRGSGFELKQTRITPKRPLFDGPRRIRLRYRFAARERVDLRLRVLDLSSGNTVRVWRERGAGPRKRLERRWDGLNRRGRAVAGGRYEFRVGPLGGRDRSAGRLRLRGHTHPVDGRHRDRGPVGRFGAGRNGGRTHEGYDILAPCGTPLVAARGGKVAAVGYDPRLYGWFVRIRARKSKQQHFYSHLIERPDVGRGDRIRTGERLGRVGQTGNAASTPCHLHFELRKAGRLVDPRPALRRWER